MHMPDTCPTPALLDNELDQSSDLDAILADAEVRDDHSEWLAADLGEWRRGLVTLLDETRSDLAAINAEVKTIRQDRQHKRRAELAQERAVLVERQRALDTRLRYVKSQEGQRGPATEPGDLISQGLAHLHALFDILRLLAEEKNPRDTP